MSLTRIAQEVRRTYRQEKVWKQTLRQAQAWDDFCAIWTAKAELVSLKRKRVALAVMRKQQEQRMAR